MTTSVRLWTRELIDRRRALHARIDGLAGRAPADAARLRLATYTLMYDVEAGRVTVDVVGERLAELEDAARAVTAAA